MWLLDTNVWIRYLNMRSPSIIAKFREHRADEILLCDVVKAELYYGAYKSQSRDRNLALLATLFQEFDSLPFDGNSARVYGEIRADLVQRGVPIGPYDLQIAAIALSNRVTLVTHNTAEFGRIRELQFEDWEGGTI